jgi:two-component system NtrC family sensor kinase
MEPTHSLLKRQLKKFRRDGNDIPEEWQEFIQAVNDAYHGFDNDRRMLEHSMEISSQELFESNQEIKKTFAKMKASHEQLKKAQSQLLHSEKMASIGQLAAGVAHEINNPVGFIASNVQTLEEYIKVYNSVIGFTEGLSEAVRTGDIAHGRQLLQQMQEATQSVDLEFIKNDISKLVEESKKGVERVKTIVADLRTFSRQDDEKKTLVSIESVIEGVLGIVQNEIKYKAELRKEYGQTPQILCHPQQLGQVFVNLLVNAVHAIGKKGTITIRTYEEKGFVCAQVIDTGEGIPPEVIPKIFDPFYTTKEIGKGTGLGLSISYEIVKNLCGTITVDSEVGRGTTFTVMIMVPDEKDVRQTTSGE